MLRPSFSRVALLSVAVLMTACPPKVPKPPVKTPPAFDPLLASMIATLPLNTPGGCTPSNVFRGARARDFTVQALFATRRNPTQQAEQPPPPRLARFCRVTPKSRRPFRIEQVEEFKSDAQANVRLAPDYPLVTLAGDVFDASWPAFRDAFLAKAGRVEAVGPVGANPVRVALVDAAAGGAPDWAVTAATGGQHENHGVVLARLIQELTCDNGDPTTQCLTDVRGYQALNTTIDNVTVGSQGDLASAIYDATYDADPNLPWILNLSLGWAPIPALGGTPGSDDEGALPGAASVHEALEFAVCNNAAVFAASGNDLGGPNGFYDDGPIYPARWEHQYRNVDCGQFGLSKTVNWPLVFSVSAIELQNRRLSISRTDSFGGFAAYGFGGVGLRAPGSADATTALSGTSVATAVASAAAAAAWAVEPALTAGDLYRQLHKSLDKINATAGQSDFPDPNGNKEIADVRVCKALQEACNRAGSCGQTIACPSPPPVVNVAMGSFGPGVANMSPSAGWVKNNNCVTLETWIPAGGAGAPYKCPEDLPTSVDELPWVNPQPGWDPCDACLFKVEAPTNQLVFTLEKSALGGFGEAWLLVEGAGGMLSAYDIGAAVRVSGSSLGGLTTPVLVEGIVLPGAMGGPYSGKLLGELAGSAGNASVAGPVGRAP